MDSAVKPIWSLCHCTARLPESHYPQNNWRKAYDQWKKKCDDWSKIEYILCVDTADKENWPDIPEDVILVENTGRQCAVDASNKAASVSTGKVLISATDDIYPPEHWDTELLKVISDLDAEFVIDTKSGTTPADWPEYLWMLISFMSRAYYEKFGYMFYPEFEGMYADLWFTDKSRKDGVVINARHLTFQHHHWIGTTVHFDEIYQRQNSQERYDRGLGILGRLQQESSGQCSGWKPALPEKPAAAAN
jgi:hypothetical protein